MLEAKAAFALIVQHASPEIVSLLDASHAVAMVRIACVVR